jgi:type IV fimbrial biogenesis protein FimT
MSNQRNGFTLPELLISITIIAILSSLAIPGFRHINSKNSADSTISQLQHTISLARQTAIARRQNTIICPSSDGYSCDDTTDWSAGSIVFIDSNNSEAYEAEEERNSLLQRSYPVNKHSLLQSNRRMIKFNSYGLLAGTAQRFTYCDSANNDPAYGRTLRLNFQGRVTIEHQGDCS